MKEHVAARLRNEKHYEQDRARWAAPLKGKGIRQVLPDSGSTAPTTQRPVTPLRTPRVRPARVPCKVGGKWPTSQQKKVATRRIELRT